jgi:predicted nucleic acid-binding protein
MHTDSGGGMTMHTASSTAIFLEYEAVVLRPEQRLATGMSPDDVESFLAAFAAAAEPVDVSFLWRPQLRDPADELMLEAAVSGRAERLLTHNIKDFEFVTGRLDVKTMTPGAFLKELTK